jgi:hypothetical protein
MFYDPTTRVLLRTRPNPLTPEQVAGLRGARPAGPTLTIAVSGTTLTIELDDAETRVVRRTTTTPARNIKADRPWAASSPGTSRRTQVPHGLVKDT